MSDILAGKLAIRRDGDYMVARIELDNGTVFAKRVYVTSAEMEPNFFAVSAAAGLIDDLLNGAER